MTTSGSALPARMLRQGRGPIENFEPTEPLYLRCTRENVDALPGSGLGVRFPDFSVNRGGAGFGPASDVLLPSWPQQGVAEFLVRDIPPRIDSEPGTRYEFRVYHDPLEENYAHSEVRTLKNGVYDRESDIKSKIVKKEFRQRLGEKMRVVIMPQI